MKSLAGGKPNLRTEFTSETMSESKIVISNSSSRLKSCQLIVLCKLLNGFQQFDLTTTTITP